MTEAKAGVIPSSNGNERTMPAPRRNARRESAVRVEINGPVLDGVVLMADNYILDINRQVSRAFGGEFFQGTGWNESRKNFV